MERYQDQGEGEIVPGRGIDIVEILLVRRTLATHLELRSGERAAATNASYGRDIGDEWEHILYEEHGKTYFLMTSEVRRLVDPESGAVLYERQV
jgi:hypothetical protein